jgi:dethiobiotin synthetase
MPELVVVAGTGTEVGKTWVTAETCRALRAGGLSVAARKPAQSFEPGTPAEQLDSFVLAAATGEDPEAVCPARSSYPAAMAPPMAAAALGRPAVGVAEMVDAIRWPARIDVGFVETAGGVRSPAAVDGDNVDLIDAIRPGLVLLVAEAGLGAINLVRVCAAALAGHDVLVVLNRYDPAVEIHERNRAWLADRDGFRVVTSIAAIATALSARRRQPTRRGS